MIKGCIQLGSAPDLDATVEMVPVDYVSKAIVHLSRQKQLPSNIFHVAGRHRLSLRELFSLVGSFGYLLTGFTDGPPLSMPVFDCRHTLDGLQGTQIECPQIDKDLMSAYLTHFKNCGFFDM
jgi:hypothetical protein